MRNIWKRIIPLIGIAFFVYLLIDIGVSNIIDSLMGANPFYIGVMFAILIPHLALQTAKWKRIINLQGIEVGFSDIFRIYIIGVFYSVLTPGKVGTLIRIVYLKEKSGKGTGECASSVFIDRIMDLLSMFFLAFVGVAFLVNYISGTMIFAIILLFAFFVFAIVVLMKESIGRRVFPMVYNIAVPSKYKERAKKASVSFYENIPSIKNLILPFLMTLTSWTLVYTAMYFAAVSLNINIPFLIFITIAPIATIVGLIPITISGWGTREGALIAIFSPFTSSAGTLVAMSFISFITLSLIPAVLGSFLALKKTVKKK